MLYDGFPVDEDVSNFGNNGSSYIGESQEVIAWMSIPEFNKNKL